jgi:hypothetical protein
MKKTLIAGLAGLSLAFAAMPALADGKKSVDATPIAELAADPTSKAILVKELGDVTQHPAYDQFKGMTLRQLQPMAGGMLTEEKLTAIQAGLDSAAPASGAAPAAKPASK